MTRLEVEQRWGERRRKPLYHPFAWIWSLPTLLNWLRNLIQWGILLHKSRIWWYKRNTREHEVRVLDSMGANAHDVDLCIREFSKFLIDRACTCYVNLKPGSMHNWEHLVSLLKQKFFSIGAELRRMRWHPRENQDIYVRRFHENALDCYDQVAKQMLVDIHLHSMMEEYWIFRRICFSVFSFSKLIRSPGVQTSQLKRLLGLVR